jgi:hypothetical protein
MSLLRKRIAHGFSMKTTKIITYLCIDCGKNINYKTALYGEGRCYSCCRKHYIKTIPNAYTKENNSQFKDGRTLIDKKCKCCNKSIGYISTYCRPCSYKFRKPPTYKRIGKLTHGRWGEYKGIKMRSSYERKYAEYLDKNSIKWYYEPKFFDIGGSNYVPDFYLPEFDEYVEIKGFWRDDALYKFEKFKSTYPDLKIKLLTSSELTALGIDLLKTEKIS